MRTSALCEISSNAFGRRIARRLFLCASLGAALLTVSCSSPAPTEHVAEYEVRGRVEEMPSPDSPAAEFKVHHEPIPSFRATWPDGNLGMNSMIMPFPVAEGLSLTGIEVGDIVELTFEVRYDAETGALKDYEVTDIATLPADTELNFGTVSGRGRAEDSPRRARARD